MFAHMQKIPNAVKLKDEYGIPQGYLEGLTYWLLWNYYKTVSHGLLW